MEDRQSSREPGPGQEGLPEDLPEKSGELDRLLAGARISVREGFTEKVMARLPQAGWNRPRANTWAAAIGLLLAFTLGGALLLGGDLGAYSLARSVGALADLFISTLLAGAGLLAASWSGLSAGVQVAFGDSPSSLFALGGAVVVFNVLLIHLLRRRRTAVREGVSERDSKNQ